MAERRMFDDILRRYRGGEIDEARRRPASSSCSTRARNTSSSTSNGNSVWASPRWCMRRKADGRPARHRRASPRSQGQGHTSPASARRRRSFSRRPSPFPQHQDDPTRTGDGHRHEGRHRAGPRRGRRDHREHVRRPLRPGCALLLEELGVRVIQRVRRGSGRHTRAGHEPAEDAGCQRPDRLRRHGEGAAGRWHRSPICPSSPCRRR